MQKFSLDTSTIIEAWERRYPITIFLPLWNRLDEMISDGQILVCEEVFRELEKKEDGAYLWFKDRKDDARVAIDENTMAKVTEILAVFPRMVNATKGRSGADPWVVATAILNNAAVVTEESRRREPRIPFVCEHFGIGHTNLLGFVQQMNLRL